MIIRIKDFDFSNAPVIRVWLNDRGLFEQDHQYQFEYYGYEYNEEGDLQFYPIIHFKQDNLLSGPELTEFILKFGI